tara:strand:- start:40 stop:528 length:489 start_codon:yes stop_codon:yes gene_type:complete
MDDYNMVKILFVCTGNICRSPSAEAVFRHIVANENLSDAIIADSVGLHGFHVGEPPDARAIAAASQRGYSMLGLRSRRIHPQDFDTFDFFLTMDIGHFEALHQICPRDQAAKIEMFLSAAPNCGATDVPDPFYGSMKEFERALDLIEIGANAWLERIKQSIF